MRRIYALGIGCRLLCCGITLGCDVMMTISSPVKIVWLVYVWVVCTDALADLDELQRYTTHECWHTIHIILFSFFFGRCMDVPLPKVPLINTKTYYTTNLLTHSLTHPAETKSKNSPKSQKKIIEYLIWIRIYFCFCFSRFIVCLIWFCNRCYSSCNW